eukprot:Opistho-2@38456
MSSRRTRSSAASGGKRHAEQDVHTVTEDGTKEKMAAKRRKTASNVSASSLQSRKSEPTHADDSQAPTELALPASTRSVPSNCIVPAGNKCWLMKSEPDLRLEKGVDISCSIKKLQSLEGMRVPWYGVRNYQARNFMRDDMRIGDLAFFYHSSCKEPGIAGIVRICKASHPDDTQFDAKNPYFDAKSTRENPRWHMVEVGFVCELERFVSLAELKAYADGPLRSMALLQRSRLSVQPVTLDVWDFVMKLSLNPQT